MSLAEGSRKTPMRWRREREGIIMAKEGDKMLAPPGWYLLFLVNGGRVPSVGRWIRLH
jgi:hypothetical protein